MGQWLQEVFEMTSAKIQTGYGVRGRGQQPPPIHHGDAHAVQLDKLRDCLLVCVLSALVVRAPARRGDWEWG